MIEFIVILVHTRELKLYQIPFNHTLPIIADHHHHRIVVVGRSSLVISTISTYRSSFFYVRTRGGLIEVNFHRHFQAKSYSI